MINGYDVRFFAYLRHVFSAVQNFNFFVAVLNVHAILNVGHLFVLGLVGALKRRLDFTVSA